jgi:hypothetical protein
LIKQHLRLHGFFSTDPNGVRVQIWTALCAYLLAAIAKREKALQGSLHQVLQVISIAALERAPLPDLFAKVTTTNDSQPIHIHREINGFGSDSRWRPLLSRYESRATEKPI